MKFESFIRSGVPIRSLGRPGEGSGDVFFSIGVKHIFAGSLEGVADYRGAHDEANSVGDLKLASFGLFAFHVIFPENVLIVEVFSEDESKSVSSGSRVSSSETSQVSVDEVSKIVDLTESLFEIISDREAVEPVLEEFTGHGRVSGQGVLTVLDNLTERSDGVVTSMVELVQLNLLLLDLGGRSFLDTSFKSCEALFHDGTEVFRATALGNNSNSIGGSLTERRSVRGDETANSLYENLVISRLKVVRAKVLNDIIKYEKGKLLSLLFSGSEGFH